jgi:hypothetical protein
MHLSQLGQAVGQFVIEPNVIGRMGIGDNASLHFCWFPLLLYVVRSQASVKTFVESDELQVTRAALLRRVNSEQ